MFRTLHFKNSGIFFILLALMAGLLVGIVGVSAVSNAQNTQTFVSGTRLPIIMYHSLLKEKNRQGKYVISPDLLESDMKYLKQHGYTPINMQDLIDYEKAGKPLPAKPVMLTFDDGYYNNYLYAFPLAKQYQFKIVISPIGYYTDKFSEKDADHANYSHITWDEINEMMNSGYVEIQNHTYNLHASGGKNRLGAQKLKSESAEQYAGMLIEDLKKMQDEMMSHTGKCPTTFTFPFGAISEEAIPVIKSLGFQATLTCSSRVNIITTNPECLYGLGRFLRPAGISTEKYFASKLKLK